VSEPRRTFRPAPADLPRREVEAKLYRRFGLVWLLLKVWRQGSPSKRTGEVKLREHRTEYRVELDAPGVVRLITAQTDAATGEPVVYHTTADGCSCPDANFNGRRVCCKHRAALMQLAEDGEFSWETGFVGRPAAAQVPVGIEGGS
jgi:hypothetical protein